MIKKLYKLFLVTNLLNFVFCINASETYFVTEKYEETYESFRNPIKGFRPSRYPGQSHFTPHEYASVYKHYIPYTSLEVNKDDGVEKIKEWCNLAWNGIKQKNIKVIPRVIINYPGTGEWWPFGVPYGSIPGERWNSEELKNRLVDFVAKLGEAWDNDSRVAAVEMGLWGYWGEHHIFPESLPGGGDRIPIEFQNALGTAFKNAFKNKKIMVRHPNTFSNFEIGYFWDSFALPDDMDWANWIQSREIWPKQMISGEVAYDWGDRSKLGNNPNETLRNTSNADYLIQHIRSTHCSSLGWISDYTPDGNIISSNAARVQRELGYRFVITEATFPRRVDPGSILSIRFRVNNRGNAPFYYNWPLKINILSDDKSIKWSGKFEADIREWMPGLAYDVTGIFVVPVEVSTGTYTLALSINDPDGDLPSLRFANINYYNGGLMPIGRLGVGQDSINQNLGSFDLLKNDNSLQYGLTSHNPSSPTSTSSGSVGTVETLPHKNRKKSNIKIPKKSSKKPAAAKKKPAAKKPAGKKPGGAKKKR